MTSLAQELAMSRDSFVAEINGYKKASEILKVTAENIHSLLKQANKDFDDGVITRPGDDLETIKLVKHWIMRCFHSIESQSDQVTVNGLQFEGRMIAMNGVLDTLEKKAREHGSKAKLLKAVESGEETGRVRGAHPGLSLKAQRQAEAAAEQPPKPKTRKRAAKPKDAAQGDSGASEKLKSTRRRRVKPAPKKIEEKDA